VYRATETSGDPVGGRAGEDGVGTLAQGFLEGSNVRFVDEMVDLMLAQRAYEASVKVVQASDEMLGMINALRK
jgi:flagellar basal-body rod protein FlgG